VIELVQQPLNQGQRVLILDGESIQSPIIDTHSQRAIFLFDKEDKGINWKLGLLNEPLLEVFINVFMKRCKFNLQQIIDGPNEGCAPSTRSMVQSYGSCLCKVFTFLFLNTYLNSWYWEGISCECDSTACEGEHK
jgi:hypothetical protein